MLGAVLLWISLICAGVIYSTKLKRRISLLEKTIMMLVEMKILLEYLNTPVCDLIIMTRSKDYLKDLKFLDVCYGYIELGKDFPAAWKESLESTPTLYMTQEKERLLQLGANLGTSNKESQINIISLQIVSFEDFLIKAKNKHKKYSGTATTLGVLSGCMIFILVI